MATEIVINTATVPQDESPDTDTLTGDYDPQYPGSTPEAPYGYKADGTAYTRRPRGTAPGATKRATLTPAPDRTARTAAALLSRMNGLVGISLMALGMPATATSLAEANSEFENMAYEALLSDPALCKKILSAGATSGKAGLIMAYGMLGISIAPAAVGEIKARRAEMNTEENYV